MQGLTHLIDQGRHDENDGSHDDDDGDNVDQDDGGPTREPPVCAVDHGQQEVGDQGANEEPEEGVAAGPEEPDDDDDSSKGQQEASEPTRGDTAETQAQSVPFHLGAGDSDGSPIERL